MAVSEHVENAGVHSGDATLVTPPQVWYFSAWNFKTRYRRSPISAVSISADFALSRFF